MKQLTRMQYKDFVFPQNPAEIKVESSGLQTVKSVNGETPFVNGGGRKPVVVSGEGSFYGDNAVTDALSLQHFLSSSESGWLIVPASPPIKAFLTSFSSVCNAVKNCVFYTFTFTEDCSHKKYGGNPKYTYAQVDENLFDVSRRTGVSIDKIMEVNDFETPFSVRNQNRVMLE